MNIKKLSILFCFVFMVMSLSAMNYQIKVLNTPTITINGKELKVGDWFDDLAIITWSKENQAMRVLSEDNRVYTLSAKLFKEIKAKKFSDFILYTKPLAARGNDSLTLKEVLEEKFDNNFIMLDEIVIDFTGIELPEELALYYIVSNHENINGNFIVSKSAARLSRAVFNDLELNDLINLSLEVYMQVGKGESILVTDYMDIEIVPLDESADNMIKQVQDVEKIIIDTLKPIDSLKGINSVSIIDEINHYCNLINAEIELDELHKAKENYSKLKSIVTNFDFTDHNNLYDVFLDTAVKYWLYIGSLPVSHFYSKVECDIIEKMASHECDKSNYEHAIELVQKIVPLLKKGLGENHEEYIYILEKLCVYNAYAENYDRAIEIIKKVLLIKKYKFGEKHIEYASSLQLLALIYEDVGEYQEAIIEETKVLNIIELNSGQNNFEYVESLDNLARYFHNNGNYVNAINHGLKSLKIKEKINGISNADYASSLSELSLSYAYNGQYSESVRLAKEALRIREEIIDEDSVGYAQSLGSIALIFRFMGNYEESKCFYEKALNIADSILDKDDSNYLTWLNNLSVCNYYLGCIGESIKIIDNVLKIKENVYGNNHVDYAESLHNKAAFLDYIGDHSKAIELEEEAMDIYKKHYGILHPKYAEALSNLGNFYSNASNYKDALSKHLSALTVYEKTLGKNHPDYIQCFSKLSVYYSNKGNYLKAMEIEKDVLKKYAKTIGKIHPNYIMSLRALANYYEKTGHIKTAIKLLLKVLDITNNYYPFSDYHAGAIGDLSLLYYRSNNIEDFERLWRKYFELLKKRMKNELMSMTFNNRSSWIEDHHHFFKILVPCFAEYTDYDLFSDLVYNSTLISKGIILDTESEFSKLIKDTRDTTVINLYNEYHDNLIYYDKLRSTDNYKTLDSLEIGITNLEYQLIEKSKAFGDFTRNLLIDWRQVQSKLEEDEIAIEFISYPSFDDSIVYCALTLKRGYDKPRMVAIFKESQLNEATNDECYTNTAVSELVWGTLKKELEGVKNIYFAPDGELYNIAIESLKDFDGKGYMFDKWNFYRLSSTRELVKIKHKKNSAHVVLYGGLKYDTDGVVFDKDSMFLNNKFTSIGILPDTIDLRASYGYLRGTLKEVKHIDSLYSEKHSPTVLFTDVMGTETSIKNYSGKKLSNLHIATHGFYWSEKEMKKQHDLHNLNFMIQDNRSHCWEDKAMTRSGLLFAGANYVLSGDTIPNGCNDGILTAKEIALLDFRGLDLLVLSACQTGLGEIKGDGVFGLQRGFKKAGVQSIVMSLWKVDDDATQILMNNFYRNYLDGMPKLEALIQAQKIVRETPGFEDPEFWAGFVLLDGVN